jgi:hypothetical protein
VLTGVCQDSGERAIERSALHPRNNTRSTVNQTPRLIEDQLQRHDCETPSVKPVKHALTTQRPAHSASHPCIACGCGKSGTPVKAKRLIPLKERPISPTTGIHGHGGTRLSARNNRAARRTGRPGGVQELSNETQRKARASVPDKKS